MMGYRQGAFTLLFFMHSVAADMSLKIRRLCAMGGGRGRVADETAKELVRYSSSLNPIKLMESLIFFSRDRNMSFF
jgi:hypothetical protein